jgi:hypothetical protein
MFEANVNFEVENKLVETLATATLESLLVASLDGVTTNERERTAYTAGFLAAIAIFTDTATSIDVLKKMSGKE